MSEKPSKYLTIVNGTIISHGIEIKDGIVVVYGDKIIDVGQYGLMQGADILHRV